MRSVVFPSRFGAAKWLAGLAATLVLGSASIASAQPDINPPPPNVLLLIDTSGSMELMADGTMPVLDAQEKCAPPLPGQSNMNRWATLVSVLTGTVQNFSCYAQPRTAVSGFDTEFSLFGVLPYDLGYHLPFHRILSNNCTTGPGTMTASWPGWPANAIKYHAWNNAGTVCGAPGFSQVNDGLMDTFANRVRFGLMTFDPSIPAGTGASGTSVDAITGMRGIWSYYPNWNGGGSPATGNPPSCAGGPYEVGARNQSAPPWEGRLMGFGSPTASATDMLTSNDRVQQVLLAMRPYGATPLAGMFQDAYDFILNDTSTDTSTGQPFAPAGDGYFTNGCRPTYIILLSDGEPNLDLRKEGCATGDGKCPYPEAYTIAHDLATNADPKKRVYTFSVGFGLSTTAGVDCNTLGPADFLPGGQCETPTAALEACCNLVRIAIEGDPPDGIAPKAFFADDPGGLKTALSTVLNSIAASSTSRTYPTFSGASASGSAQGDAQAAGYQILSSFTPNPNSPTWMGNLQRRRYKCDPNDLTQAATLEDIAPSKGDDFGDNLNSNDPAHPRKFFTVVGPTVAGLVFSDRSIRPALANANIDDTLGIYGGTVTGSGAAIAGPSFASEMATHPEALSIDPGAPPLTCSSLLNTGSAATCSERVIRWEVGEVDVGLPTRDASTCKASGTVCSELGSIYHANPIVVGPPADFLRSESYDIFADAQRGRASMVYAATTDGQLHAFKLAANDPADSLKVDQLANNELWSFLPPAVLPKLLTTYNQQSILLDGQLVSSDVVFEKTLAQAAAGTGTWHTVLVGSGGQGGGFYYALDITNPASPQFLWQLSTNNEGGTLFGPQVPQAAITRLNVKDGALTKEVAVAVLSGGSAPLLAGSCNRAASSFPKVDVAPRPQVRCWGNGPGQSLTFVRLDTGEVIMTLKSPAAVMPSGFTRTKTVQAFDSPITGVPVPYPPQLGQVASRIYVGDADGTMWRVDVSKPNPADWDVELAWDAHNGDAATAGEPIQTVPTLSVDALNNVVLLFATGDQDLLTSTAPATRLVSITEQATATSYLIKQNWKEDFTNGERVTGGISLYNGAAYFTTFAPVAAAASCAFGDSWVWGVHYTRPTKDAMLPDPNNAGTFIKKLDLGPAVSVGVAITQTPPCVETTVLNDAYFGAYTAVTGGSTGKVQLAVQAGTGNQGAVGGAKTKTITMDLPTPRERVFVDSWASVVE